jgi:hypothetical protein
MIRENFWPGSTAVSVMLNAFSCLGIAVVLFAEDKMSLCISFICWLISEIS